MRIVTSAKKLKVTAVVDAAPFAALVTISDNAPSRTALFIAIEGMNITADISTKSLRRAVKTLNEHSADNVMLIIQGTLTGNSITECGLVANIKAGITASAAGGNDGNATTGVAVTTGGNSPGNSPV